MEESIKSGALSSSSTEFQIGTLVLRSGTTFASEPFAVFLLWALLVVLAPFWGSGSLAGGISPSSATSLPFFSLFLFFFGGSVGEVQLGIGGGPEEEWIPSAWTFLHAILVAQVGWYFYTRVPWLLVHWLSLGCCWYEWKVDVAGKWLENQQGLVGYILQNLLLSNVQLQIP